MQKSQQPKLDTVLANLAAKTTLPAQRAFAQSESLRLSAGRVQVQVAVRSAGLTDVIQALQDAGGEVTGVSASKAVIQGWLPTTALTTLTANPDVLLIRRPVEATLLQNEIVTEGASEANAPAWHNADLRGQNTKIAIIDGGFAGYTGLLGSELPASVTVRNFVDGESDAQVDGSSDHGAACAEIAYDLAPDAQFYLVKVATDIDLEEAVNWLIDVAQVDIISTSLGWYGISPRDGTGFFADLVQRAHASGVFWATAAGNERQRHWGGAFSDPNNNDAHNFNGDQEINYFGPGDGDAYLIPSGVRLDVHLSWDDWTNVDQDYDLLLLRWNGSGWTVIAAGVDLQEGQPGQQPLEYVSAVTDGSPTVYGFVVVRYRATRNVCLEVFTPGVARIDEIVPDHGLTDLAQSSAVIVVGAVDVNPPYPQEAYSSEGPTGSTCSSNSLIKPDFAAYDNVSTAAYGPGGFAGTSAATPHVAAAAALVASAFPAYGPDQIVSFLAERAIDMGSAGKDVQFGFGRLFLGTPQVPTLITINDVSINEGNSGTAATFTVALSAASNETVTVRYATVDETATAGSDYIAQSGTVTFTPGITLQSLTIQVIGDTVIEPDETFYIDLSAASNATISDGQGLGAIVNDDALQAFDDLYAIEVTKTLTVTAPGVLTNDIGSSLVAITDTNPSQGVLTLKADGSFVYQPDADFTGTDSFLYHVNNGESDSNMVRVTFFIRNFFAFLPFAFNSNQGND